MQTHQTKPRLPCLPLIIGIITGRGYVANSNSGSAVDVTPTAATAATTAPFFLKVVNNYLR